MNATLATDRRSGAEAAEPFARGAAVAFALVAASIHASLGSLLYTLNAVGFAVLAIGLVVPLEWAVGDRVARGLRTLVRLAMLGFSLATITGWVLIGARITLGFMSTGVEVAIVVSVVVSIVRATGGPVAVAHELLALGPARVRRA